MTHLENKGVIYGHEIVRDLQCIYHQVWGLCYIVVLQFFHEYKNIYIIQIYHVLEGYLQNISFKRIKISQGQKGEEIFFLETGIFCKYPSHTWYIFLITPNIFTNLLFSILIVMNDIYSNEKNSIFLLCFLFFHTYM